MSRNTLFRFGPFGFDSRHRQLYREDTLLPLPISALGVLEALLLRAPHTVGKSELLDAGWPDTEVVPDNLVQAIRSIRNVLEEDARKPEYVQTVHRRGYRFLAPVRLTEAEEGDARISVRESSASGLPETSGSRRAAGQRIGSLAVLPLANLSGDSDQEFFADGMTDALITELARMKDVDVISRTSVMKFKHTLLSVPKIARELHVDALVEGTITRGGGRIRVIAQLVDAEDHHIWGENYESADQDILRLQRKMAEAVAAEIGARLQVPPTPASGVDPLAHDAFLRGEYLLRKRKKSSILKAQTFFSEALEKDPRYAPAYAGLADTYNLLANYGFSPSPSTRSQAREMAIRALEIDSGLAEGHLALALVAAEYDWDFDRAEEIFNEALKLRASNAEIRARHAQLLVARGRISDAVEEIRYACRLDPLSEIINSNTGWFLFFDGAAEEAEKKLLDVLDYSPDFVVALYYLGSIYDSQTRFDEAIPLLSKARELTGSSSYTRAALCRALARSGDRRRAEIILETLIEDQQKNYVSPVALAVANFGLDRIDQGFGWLDAAFRERKGWLLGLRVEPVMDSLRQDPRYLDLVGRIGLPPLVASP